MGNYVVLLRGVNVGGKNKLVMSDLRQQVTDMGFVNVKTYINSGNLSLLSVGLSSCEHQFSV